MDVYPDSLKKLISQFSTLPGIGKKTAERLSIYMLNANKDKITNFTLALDGMKDSIKVCEICFCFIEDDNCHICNDVHRDSSLICVVKDPTDIFLIEKSGFKFSEVPTKVNEIRPSVSVIFTRIPRTLKSLFKLRFQLFKESLNTNNL